jgi:predicted nucleic acid-binding protein
VRYWDTSAIVGLLVDEASSVSVRQQHASDNEMTTWWGTEVECVSALARLEREGRLGSAAVGAAFQRLDRLAAGWVEISPSTRLRTIAERLLRVHALRAGDAFQLAAAIIAADDRPGTLPLVTRDDRLALAAEREGFPTITQS